MVARNKKNITNIHTLYCMQDPSNLMHTLQWGTYLADYLTLINLGSSHTVIMFHSIILYWIVTLKKKKVTMANWMGGPAPR
jgi:hypothetical protein